MICDKCGRLSPKGANYCVYCGNSQGVFASERLKTGSKQAMITPRQTNAKEPSMPSLPDEPKLPSETNMMVDLFNTKTGQIKTGAKTGYAQTIAPPSPGGNVAMQKSYPGLATPPMPSAHYSPGSAPTSPHSAHYGLPYQGQSDSRPTSNYKTYTDEPVDDTPPPGGKSVAKSKGAGGCAVVFILISIMGVLASLGTAIYNAIGFGDSTEESQTYATAFYDDITPQVDQPVTVLDNDDFKMVIDGGGGVLQGSTTYPTYSVPMLIENKTDRDVNMYFDAVTADGISTINNVMISPYTNLSTGEQNGWDIRANSETLCWLEVSRYESDDRIRNLTATLVVYDLDNYDRRAAYPITILEL